MLARSTPTILSFQTDAPMLVESHSFSIPVAVCLDVVIGLVNINIHTIHSIINCSTSWCWDEADDSDYLMSDWDVASDWCNAAQLNCEQCDGIWCTNIITWKQCANGYYGKIRDTCVELHVLRHIRPPSLHVHAGINVDGLYWFRLQYLKASSVFVRIRSFTHQELQMYLEVGPLITIY